MPPETAGSAGQDRVTDSAAGQFHRDHKRDMADPEYASAFREASAEVTPTAAFDEPTARVTKAVYGGIDEWDVRLTVFTGHDSITEERLREVLPEVLKGGICIGVEVRRASRVNTD